MPGRVLIVHPPTMGMRHDRMVLVEAISACDPQAQVHFLEVAVAGHHDYVTPLNVQALAEWAPFDCVFLLEEARSNPPLFDKGFAKKVAFVPNIEWILPVDERSLADHPVDIILLKTIHARQCMASTPLRVHLPRAQVVGWTSLDIGHDADVERPFETACLHVAGTSQQKGTSLLLEAWGAAPRLPKLTVVRHLLPDPTAFQQPLDLAANITLHSAKLPDHRLRRLQAEHGIHIYPSIAEGFGHALNEARALGRVLVTTNAPPMRDLVEDGVTGRLIHVDPANIHTLQRASAYFVTPRALHATVAGLLDRDPAFLREMGRRAREAFLRDKAFFHQDFGRIWRDLR